MAEIIGLPKLSPTMEEGVLIRWVKKEGESVEPGDLVAEVETDKANMDFNLEDEGILLKLLVAEGDTVALGAPVAILGEKGEDISELLAQVASGAGSSSAAPAQNPPSNPENNTSSTQSPPSQSTIEGAAAGGGPPKVMGDSSEEAVSKSQSAPATAAQPVSASGGRLLASPLAKTLAIELGVDLRQVSGSGPGGRIVERDVRDAAQDGTAPQASAPSVAPPSVAITTPSKTPADSESTQTTTPMVFGADDYHDEPLSNMRKRIAERLTQAKRDVPHFYLRRTVFVDELFAYRKRLNDVLDGKGKISVNDLLIKACALALRQIPQCNASFQGESIRYYRNVHIGVAVALESGLVTPVVRHADLKGLGVIASEVKDLATRARDRKLKVHEIQGSTFTISNLGMFGIGEFEAIINPPEGAILAVGTATPTPTVVDGEITIKKQLTLSLSCDHRVIDGALGARYLQGLAAIIEQPESLAL